MTGIFGDINHDILKVKLMGGGSRYREHKVIGKQHIES